MAGLIGVFGGTFDPPHYGHLILAEEARQALHLERVLWVVTSRPPHKPHQPVTAVDERLALVQAAIAGNPAFAISLADVERPAPHYAVGTLRWLQARHPDAGLVYLMGSNSLRDLPSWHAPQEFIEACTAVAVMRRPGAEVDLVRLERTHPRVAFAGALLRCAAPQPLGPGSAPPGASRSVVPLPRSPRRRCSHRSTGPVSLNLLLDPSFLAAGLAHFAVDLLNSQRPVLLAYLSVPLGLTNTLIGFISLFYTFSASLSQPLFGWLSDRLGARWIAAGGLLWMACMFSLAVISPGKVSLVLLVLAALGSGAFHPAGTVEAAETGRVHFAGRETTAASIFFLCGQMGYTVGPALGGPIVGGWGPKGLLVLAPLAVASAIFATRRLTLTKPHRVEVRRNQAGMDADRGLADPAAVCPADGVPFVVADEPLDLPAQILQRCRVHPRRVWHAGGPLHGRLRPGRCRRRVVGRPHLSALGDGLESAARRSTPGALSLVRSNGVGAGTRLRGRRADRGNPQHRRCRGSTYAARTDGSRLRSGARLHFRQRLAGNGVERDSGGRCRIPGDVLHDRGDHCPGRLSSAWRCASARRWRSHRPRERSRSRITSPSETERVFVPGLSKVLPAAVQANFRPWQGVHLDSGEGVPGVGRALMPARHGTRGIGAPFGPRAWIQSGANPSSVVHGE